MVAADLADRALFARQVFWVFGRTGRCGRDEQLTASFGVTALQGILCVLGVFGLSSLGRLCPADGGSEGDASCCGAEFHTEHDEGIGGRSTATGSGRRSMEYFPVEVPGSAARALMCGRELLVSLGPITEDDLSYSLRQWKAFGAKEHVLGARAVAVVVHERSEVESLTVKQLEEIFSGDAKDWSAFGGARTAIRRYGLARNDPITRLFCGRVLGRGHCRTLMRKRTSGDVLTALRGDPTGVAFVDAVAAASAGPASGRSILRRRRSGAC